MNTLLEWYGEFIKLSQNNPAIAGFVGIYIAGLTGWLLKDLPSRIKNFVVQECFTTMYLAERGETYTEFDEKIQFRNFFEWVDQWNLTNLSRLFSITKNKENWKLVPGFGTNLFFFKGRLYWYTRTEINGSGQSHSGVKYQVHITTYGRNIENFYNIFNEFKDLNLNDIQPELMIREIDGNDWWAVQPIPQKDINKIFINDSTYIELMETLEQFNTQLERCIELQTPHRLTILLDGPTGTGKTTLIKALARYLEKHIYIMEPYDLMKDNLTRMIAKYSEDGIIVIEDVDSLGSIKSRGDFVDEDIKYEKLKRGKLILEEKPESNKHKSKSNLDLDLYDLLGGLSKVLNNLDGIVEYHGSIIIMTTNDASSIDPAMLRPGRIDKIIHVGWLTKETIIKNLIKFYSWELCELETGLKIPKKDLPLIFDNIDEVITIDSISGAKLSNIFKFAKDLDDAIKKINEGY